MKARFMKFLDLINNKVDKVTGKGLSTNDFTDEYKKKIDGTILFQGDFNKGSTTLNDDITNYKKIDVEYYLDALTVSSIKTIIVDNRELAYIHLIEGFSSDDSTFDMRSADFNINKNIITCTRNRYIKITSSSNHVGSNQFGIHITKIIGYK